MKLPYEKGGNPDMQIIKRDGETREYNVVELFAGVGALSTAMSEKIQEVCNNIQNLIDERCRRL